MQAGALSVILTLMFVPSAYAAPITVDLNAKVKSISGVLSGQLAVGDSMYFAITYDRDTPMVVQGRFVNSDPFSVNFTTNGFNFSWASSTNVIYAENNIHIGAGAWYDYLEFVSNAPTSVIPIQGQSATGMQLSIYEVRPGCGYVPELCPAMISTSSSLPTSIKIYEAPYVRRSGDFRLTFSDGSTSLVQLDYFVPIPGTIWLFASSLLTLGGIFRPRPKLT